MSCVEFEWEDAEGYLYNIYCDYKMEIESEGYYKGEVEIEIENVEVSRFEKESPEEAGHWEKFKLSDLDRAWFNRLCLEEILEGEFA